MADGELSKDAGRAVFPEITKDIPESEIALRPVKDGYTISVSHTDNTDKDGIRSVSSYTYSFERHFGREIKDVKGGFNSSGQYEVTFHYADGK